VRRCYRRSQPVSPTEAAESATLAYAKAIFAASFPTTTPGIGEVLGKSKGSSRSNRPWWPQETRSIAPWRCPNPIGGERRTHFPGAFVRQSRAAGKVGEGQPDPFRVEWGNAGEDNTAALLPEVLVICLAI
jgi:hypothetical protein